MIRPAPTNPAASAAVDAARRALLEQLRLAGPVPPAAVRARWPLTGHQVRAVLDGLVRDGLVASISGRDGGTRAPRIALTAAGHDALANGD